MNEIYHNESEEDDFNAPGCRNLMIVALCVIFCIIFAVVFSLWV